MLTTIVPKTLMLAMLTLANLPTSSAATFQVNSEVDAADEVPGDGICLANTPNLCTLRAAVQESNASPGADRIEIPAGTYVITRARIGEQHAASGDLDLTDSVDIVGAGMEQTIIDGNHIDRIFDIGDVDDTEAAVSISEVTLRNGRADAGGAIYLNFGRLELSKSALRHNHAFEVGGGLCATGNEAALRVTDVVFEGNAAGPSQCEELASGGGMFVQYLSEATIIGSTIRSNMSCGSGGGITGMGFRIERSFISNNEARGHGGGVFAAGVMVKHSTISDNSAEYGGGLVVDLNPADLINVTISGNRSKRGGTGVHTQFPGTLDAKFVTIANNQQFSNALQPASGVYFDVQGFTVASYIRSSILADNSPSNCTSEGPLPFTPASSFNIDTDDSCNFATDTSIVNTPAGLMHLGPHGGPTPTHRLFPWSPAIDNASSAHCVATQHRDQRFAKRPLGRCDIGAFER